MVAGPGLPGRGPQPAFPRSKQHKRARTGDADGGAHEADEAVHNLHDRRRLGHLQRELHSLCVFVCVCVCVCAMALQALAPLKRNALDPTPVPRALYTSAVPPPSSTVL